jgi:signal transduction histidine kinase
MKRDHSESAHQSETEISIERIGAADSQRAEVSAANWRRPSSTAGADDVDATGSATAGIRLHAEKCPIGVAVTVGHACIVSYVNPAFRTAMGRGDQMVIGRPLFDAFPALSSERVQLIVSAALNNGAETYASISVRAGSESDIATQDFTLIVSPLRRLNADDRREPAGSESSGLMIQVSDPSTEQTPTQGRPLRARRGRQSAAAAELLEVNQRLVVAALHEQELKERAEEASKAKSAFLATMSHELRTPLNAIIGYASLLDDEVWGPIQPEQHTHIARLKTSARHLLTLINDVLTLARVEADKEVVYVDEVDAVSLLDEALALTMPLAVEKRLEFSILPGEPFSIRTDRGKLLQILVNLISNAIKFTNHGGITLGAAVRNGEAEFSVKDTGIGISPMHLAHVFDMFWQVDQDLTRRVGGTGLGLNVSRRLAWLLGGRLDAESTPGEGSVFTVALPLRLPDDDVAML